MEVGEQPLRSELFSVDLLQRHARQLAQRHQVAPWKGPNRLLPRLAANEKLLRDYNEQTLQVEKIRRVTPAAEWLLDNFYLIEEQIRMARRHLPRGFSRELPHLSSGPSADLPRVYDLARELISHVDGRIDASHLTSFIAAYQETTPLKLGELWAIPIMLRLGLIENLRRVAALLTADRLDRDRANYWADLMREVTETKPSKLIIAVGDLAKSNPRLTPAFVTEFWQRMQEKASKVKLVQSWIEERLGEEGFTIEQMVQGESQSQAANQVSVGNSITSLRFLDAMNWREFVETLSVVEQTLREDPVDVYLQMDFATRDTYRHVVEQIARRSTMTEAQVAAMAVRLARAHDQEDQRLAHVGYYLLDKGVEDLERAAKTKLPARSRLVRNRPLAAYLGGIAAITGALTFGLTQLAVFANPQPLVRVAAVLVILLCASQLAVSIVNWFAACFVRPRLLPRLDYSNGIPLKHRVMVVVPTMLSSARGIENLIEGLEVRYLANRDENVCFALLTDFPDAPQEHLPQDEEWLQQVRDGVNSLNRKYGHQDGSVFYLFHRPRLWNEQDKVWMGYERKRGKLADFN
ncbi:MAG TPA: cyclic beta 1-2 glucan synthetase, partial [Candidatus Eisenbacteria bacterium]|nr:cyclic beta 1-2 glucan synthetase [Candidatus Eisenbacteria bacterium]